MTAFKAMFVGLSTIDIQYLVDEFPKANTKTKAGSPEIFVGGPAANAAVAFGRLNGGAHLVSAIGKNAFTDQVYNDYSQTGLTYTDLLRGEDFTPVIATVITSQKNGDRNIFTHHPSAIQANIDAVDLIRKQDPRIVMLDGFYPEVAIPLAKAAHEKSIPVVLDCGSWKPQYEDLFKYTDVAICSADFLPPRCIDSNDVIDYLKKAGVKHFAISRGSENILIDSDSGLKEIKIDAINAVDTLGAGDVLHGAFCYYWLKYKDFEKSLFAASQVATHSCKYMGTRNWLNSKIVVDI